MAELYFRGGASGVAEVDTFTPASVTTADVDTLTHTAEDGTVTTANFTVGGTATAAAVVTGLIAAWNGNSTLAAVATASGTSTLILTAVTAGVPFSVASSVVGTGTLTRAATTPNSGATDWNTAANWSTGAKPVNGDNVTLDGRMANAITSGLNQSGVTLGALNDYRSRRYQVGTATAALRISSSTSKILAPPPDGSSGGGSTINIDFGAVAGTFNIFSSPVDGIGGIAPVSINATHANNVLNIMGGTVAIGKLTPAQAGTFSEINVIAGNVTIGGGLTVTTVRNSGGAVVVEKVATGMTVACKAGRTTLQGAAKLGTLTLDGGIAVLNNRVSGADVGTVNMNGGRLDCTQEPSAFVGDTLNVHGGGIIDLFSDTQPTWTATTWDASDGTQLVVNVKR